MAIIKTLDEINLYAELGSELDASRILPSIQYACDFNIKTLIGSEQYVEIENAYEADTLTSVQTDLLKKMQDMAVKLGVSYYTDISELKFTNTGLTRQETGEYKTPYKYQTDNLKEHYLQRGYESAEALLEFLEENTAFFTTWAASESFSENKEFYINSAKDFNKYYEIRNSRVTFLRMMPMMRLVDRKISKLISVALADELHQQILDDNLTADNQILLDDYLKNVFVFLTMDEALQDLPVDYVGDGVLIYQFNAPSGKSGQLPNDSMLGIKRSNIKMKVEFWTNELTEFLNDNASDSKYAAYHGSELYLDPLSETENQEGNIYSAF